jgi:hypothetical protein
MGGIQRVARRVLVAHVQFGHVSAGFAFVNQVAGVHAAHFVDSGFYFW